MEFTYGELTITVNSARENETWHDSVRVTEIEPDLNVSGTVKVRGRAYTVNVDYKWLVTSRPVFVMGRESLARTHWQESHRWNAGYRSVASDRMVDYRTPTRKALDAAVMASLEWLAGEHPEWRHESERMRLARIVADASATVAELRAQLAKAVEAETSASACLAEHIRRGATSGGARPTRKRAAAQGESCGRRWVAEIELCPRCGLSAAAH